MEGFLHGTDEVHNDTTYRNMQRAKHNHDILFSTKPKASSSDVQVTTIQNGKSLPPSPCCQVVNGSISKAASDNKSSKPREQSEVPCMTQQEMTAKHVTEKTPVKHSL
uniref:Uncharacterized protein n=1 Tax=Lygus hesperus TaxID=30085 RepID=A0A146LCY0_LYGHE